MRSFPQIISGYKWIVWLAVCLASLTYTDTAPAQFGTNPLRGGPSAVAARGYVPGHVKAVTYEKSPRVAASVLNEPKVYQKTEVLQGSEHVQIDIGETVDESFGPAGGCDGDCDGSCGGGCCGTSCCMPCCINFCQALRMSNLELFGGAHGFKGPGNRGESGSFGFQYGANWAGPVPCMPFGRLGAQLGVRVAHSSLSGANFTTKDRAQVFVTGGFFQRTDCGLQGGVVVDYLHDDWYFDYDLTQVRGEVSWVFPTQHELGFWFNTNSSERESSFILRGDANTTTDIFQGTDIYSFFYRKKLDDCGTEGRLFVGFSGEKDGLIGADFNLPLTDCLALDSGFAYLIPEEGTGAGGNVGESWSVSVNLVWYPGFQSYSSRRQYRPLFRVAGNDSFFVDRN